MSRKNLSLILAFFVPVGVVVALLVVIYWPEEPAPDPKYDFYFVSHEDFRHRSPRLVDDPDTPLPTRLVTWQDKGATLYRYRSDTHRVESVSPESIQDDVIQTEKSPDGWSLEHGKDVHYSFFVAHTHRDSERLVLEGHETTIPLEIEPEIASKTRLIGWVKRTHGQN